MKKEWQQECTLEIVTTLLCDNGCLNRQEKSLEGYIATHKKEIEQIHDFFGKFIDATFDFNTDIDMLIEDITTGDCDENEEKYGHLPWWEELDNAINNFFLVM